MDKMNESVGGVIIMLESYCMQEGISYATCDNNNNVRDDDDDDARSMEKINLPKSIIIGKTRFLCLWMSVE
jgi:hypothetical protein